MRAGRVKAGDAPRGPGRTPARQAPGLRSLHLALFLALLFRPEADARAAGRVSLSLEPQTVQAGEQAVLTLTVEGASRLDRTPSVPHSPEVQIQSAGQSSNFSMINGRTSRSIACTFIVAADRPGQYVLGPVEIRDGDEMLRTDAVTLTVIAAGGGRAGAGGAPGTPGSSPPAEDAPEGGDLLFVRAIVDRDRVMVGEQIVLRFRIYRRQDLPVLDVNLKSLPSTEGFWREDLPPERSSQVTLNGQIYEVNELAYALFPTQSGRLEIGAGEVECIVQDRGRASRRRDPFDFFGAFPTQRRVALRSRALAVRADPLPEPKPSDFTGGVGSFRLRASCEPNEAAQNEPVTLTVTVEGSGNVSTVGDPEVPRLPGVRSYSSGSDVKTSRRGDVVTGTKTFRVMLVPENTGRREVPPIHLSVFDPAERRYVRLASEPLSFRVGPAMAGAVGGSGEVARVGRDLRAIRDGSRFSAYGASEPWRRAGSWVLLVLPLVWIGAGFAWRARRERREADWGRWVSRGAPGRFRRDLEQLARAPETDLSRGYDRLDAVFERYFTDRFHLPVRGMTRDELSARLETRGVAAEAVARVRELLDRCDFARFAPGSRSPEDLVALIELARALPEVLERSTGSKPSPEPKKRGLPLGGMSLWTLLLLLGAAAPMPWRIGSNALLSEACAAPRISQAGAQSELAQGNEAYRAGRYEEALRRYAGVLQGGRESADLYLNLGNAAYRAGLLGWSVYFYERGRRLAPGDPDLRANLDLVQQETKDRIPEAGSSRFLRGLVALEERGSPVGSWRALLAAAWCFGLWLAARTAFGEHSAGRAPRLVLRGLGAVLAGWFAVTLGLALLRAGQSWTGPNAVVVADELAVRSNPEPEATVEFTLHAGTRVRVGREERGHREVLFSDKLRGWAATVSLASLGSGRPPDLPRAALPEGP